MIVDEQYRGLGIVNRHSQIYFKKIYKKARQYYILLYDEGDPEQGKKGKLLFTCLLLKTRAISDLHIDKSKKWSYNWNSNHLKDSIL